MYLSDPAGDTEIQGIRCRKLGDLKNGKSASFAIGPEEGRVFVIADRMTKSYCADSVAIPAGEESITLSGENKVNPFLGNPFRFDQKPDAFALAARKSKNKWGVFIFVFAILLGVAAGIFFNSNFLFSGDGEKVFSAENMQITLTKQFKKVNFGGYTACFESSKVAVFTLREPFSAAEGAEKLSPEQYAELILATQGEAEVKHERGLCYFEYTARAEKDSYAYFAAVYKDKDAFWLIQFAVKEKDLPEYRDQFFKWAESVTFSAS